MSTLSITNITTANGSTDLTITSGNSSGASMVLSANGTGLVFKSNSSTNAFSVGPSGVTFTNTNISVANLTSSTNTFTIGTAAYFTSAGNLGIGNSAPNQKLVVSGASAANTEPTLMAMGGTAGSNGQINFYLWSDLSNSTKPRGQISISGNNAPSYSFNNAFQMYCVYADMNLFVDSANKIRLYTSSTERMVVAANGNVGIGNTVPDDKLSVSGNGRFYNPSGGGLTLNIGADRTNDYGFIQFMSKPQAVNSYTLGGVSAFSSLVSSQVKTGTIEFAKEGSGSDNKTYFQLSTHDGTNYAERIRVTSSGYIGIGTSTPACKLSVISGNTYFQVDPNYYMSAEFGARQANDGYCSVGFRANSAVGCKVDVQTGGYIIYANNMQTAVWQVDNSGRVSTPLGPSFLAVNGPSTVGNSTSTPWSGWPNVSHNRGNCFNATTGKFTAPITGTYYFNVSEYNGAAVSRAVCINVNGGNATESYHSAGGSSAQVSAVVQLSAGDWVAASYTYYNGTITTASGMGNYWRFTGHLVG